MSAYQVAEEHPDNTITYPAGLPNDRGLHSMYGEGILVIVLLGIAETLCTSRNTTLLTVPLLFFCVFGYLSVQIFLIRGCLFIEEIYHIQGRYGGRLGHMLSSVWSMNKKTLSAFAICFLVVMFTWYQYGNAFLLLHEVGPLSTFLVFMTAFLICHVIDVENSKLQNSISLEQLNGMDYGSGMAYNFFYGYLDIVLPDRGGTDKGLREKIFDYMAREKLSDVNFPVKKLFILIPSSAYTPSKLTDIADEDWMYPAGSLESHVLNRAGVTERVYKNSVYKIKNPASDEEPVYVVAEGATPLKSLHDAISRSGENQVVYKDHLQELISLFFKTLHQIIKTDRDCRDLCELVYYIDVDEHGNSCVNVAELLLDRIQKLKNMQRR